MENRRLNGKEIAVLVALVLTFLVLCLWVFPMGRDEPTTTTTTQSTTLEPTTSAVTSPVQESTTLPDTTTPDTPAQPTTADIAAAYCDAINSFKAYTGNVTVKKSETVSIEVSNLPSSISAMVNGIISSLAGTKEESYSFVGGVSAEGMAISDSVIPKGRNVSIDPAGLTLATEESLPDGGKKITLTFTSETAYYDGATNVSEPTYHRGALDPIDFSTVNLGPITVTGINIEYPGATVVAVTDPQGRLTSLHCDLPFGGDFNAKAMGTFPVELGMDCSMVTDWTVTYN